MLIRRWARTVDATTIVVLAQCGSFAIAGVLGLAVVPAASSMVQHLNEGWVRWTGALATLGFAATILGNYWAIVTTSARAAAYLAGTPATRAALTLPGAAQFIDMQGWLGYGVWVPGYWGSACSRCVVGSGRQDWDTWASLGRLCIYWCSPRGYFLHSNC